MASSSTSVSGGNYWRCDLRASEENETEFWDALSLRGRMTKQSTRSIFCNCGSPRLPVVPPSGMTER